MATLGPMNEIPPFLSRLASLVGDEAIEALRQSSVIVFGLGGVGSWAAESLARSGIGRISLVDSDTVCVTNINRQLPALHSTVGEAKAQVLAARLKDINPALEVEALYRSYAPGDGASFHLDTYDYVVDAIDSMDSKVDLIISAQAAGCKVFSSMGAGNKLDLSLIRLGDIWETAVDPMAKTVRVKLRARDFNAPLKCVYSLEKPISPRQGPPPPGATAHPRRFVNASAAHVTATFGQYLASLVIQDALSR